MTTPDVVADTAWSELASVGSEERDAAMLARYVEMADLPEEARRGAMLTLTAAEYALSEELLFAVTMSRLRVWLQMDRPQAERIAASYDAAMQRMPGPAAMRRVGVVQTLAKEFSSEDQDSLVALVPGVFGGAPIGIHVPPVPEAARSAAPAKKSWWRFARS